MNGIDATVPWVFYVFLEAFNFVSIGIAFLPKRVPSAGQSIEFLEHEA